MVKLINLIKKIFGLHGSVVSRPTVRGLPASEVNGFRETPVNNRGNKS